MKKKLLTILMAATMAISCPVMSFADEAEMTELTYDMIDSDVYDGTWITAFGVFDLYLPSDWDVLVNADVNETPENNVYFQAQSEDGSRSVAISYSQTDNGDLEQLAAGLTEQGYDEIQYMDINGIQVVTYSTVADGVSIAGIATIGDQGGCYNVTIGAAEGDEEFQAIGQNIICSFSAAEGGETAEEDEEYEEYDEEYEEEEEEE